MPELLTTAQVAQAAGVSVRTIARWVKSGRIAPALQGPGETGAYLFDPSVLDDITALERAS